MKLEHGKKYVTYYGDIVGPILELHDGRFSWGGLIWTQTGQILMFNGRAEERASLLSISHEYVEKEPDGPVSADAVAAQYTHKQVGIGITVSSPAAIFLDKVKGVVTGPREQDYGDKTENHARIAKLWNMWLNETKEDGDAITPYDVATMMLMVKLARLMQSPGHQDSHIDIAGYVACMEEIYDRQ